MYVLIGFTQLLSSILSMIAVPRKNHTTRFPLVGAGVPACPGTG